MLFFGSQLVNEKKRLLKVCELIKNISEIIHNKRKRNARQYM